MRELLSLELPLTSITERNIGMNLELGLRRLGSDGESGGTHFGEGGSGMIGGAVCQKKEEGQLQGGLGVPRIMRQLCRCICRKDSRSGGSGYVDKDQLMTYSAIEYYLNSWHVPPTTVSNPKRETSIIFTDEVWSA